MRFASRYSARREIQIGRGRCHLIDGKHNDYRVSLASAVASALACGLVAMMVSRSSSLLIEGMTDLKEMGQRPRDAVCAVAGFAAGALLGFNGDVWRQAVIVQTYALNMLLLALTWMIGLTGIFLCLSVLVTDLLNPTRERQTSSLVKIFFTPSYIPIAIWIGCGFALAGVWLAAHFPRLRLGWLLALFTAAPLASVISHWAECEQHGHQRPADQGDLRQEPRP